MQYAGDNMAKSQTTSFITASAYKEMRNVEDVIREIFTSWRLWGYPFMVQDKFQLYFT